MYKAVFRHGSFLPSIPGFFRFLPLLLICLIGLSACTPDAGIFAGGTWQSSGLVHQHIRTLTVDTNNPQNVYAGDERGQVFASTDGGQHWSNQSTGLPLPNAIHALSFDATGKKLYAATDAGLFVSTDAAQHWSAVPVNGKGLPASVFTALAFDLNAPQTIYVASQHGVIVSTNAGTTWTSIANGIPTDATINGLTFDTDHHQLWAATSLGIYRSDDRGIRWQALNDGLPMNLNVYTVQPASISGGVVGLVFAGTSQGFLRSADNGAQWAESLQSLARTQVRAVFVDFRKPTTVYVGTDVGVLRSDDSGQNWSGIASGLPRDQSVYAIELGATDYAQLFAATGDVYLYPGTTRSFGFSQLLPLLLIAALFFALYRFTRGSRRNRTSMLKPARIVEQPEPEKKTNDPRTNHLT